MKKLSGIPDSCIFLNHNFASSTVDFMHLLYHYMGIVLNIEKGIDDVLVKIYCPDNGQFVVLTVTDLFRQ